MIPEMPPDAKESYQLSRTRSMAVSFSMIPRVPISRYLKWRKT